MEYPWNLGTGSSQAILSVAGVAAVLLLKKIDISKALKFAFGFAVIPALLLDLLYAHYPKLGHTVAFAAGIMIGLYVVNKLTQSTTFQE